jgi:effector-binding domain-containing protein
MANDRRLAIALIKRPWQRFGRDKVPVNNGETPYICKGWRIVMPQSHLCSRLAVPVACALLLAVAAGPATAESMAQDMAQITPPPAQSTPGQGPAQLPDPDRDMDPGPAAPSPLLPGDAFGEQVTLPAHTIVSLKGHSNWDAAFETLVDAFKSLDQYLAKAGIKPNGPFMTIYTQTDDTGFSFEAAVPIAQAPANPPKGDIAIGQAPSGKALKFVHRGSYDAMDSTYEAITNYLDDKQLDAKDLFIEEYTSDPVKSDPKNLVINVYVPVK